MKAIRIAFVAIPLLGFFFGLFVVITPRIQPKIESEKTAMEAIEADWRAMTRRSDSSRTQDKATADKIAVAVAGEKAPFNNLKGQGLGAISISAYIYDMRGAYDPIPQGYGFAKPPDRIAADANSNVMPPSRQRAR